MVYTRAMVLIRLARNFCFIIILASLFSLPFSSLSLLGAQPPTVKAPVMLIPFKVNSLSGAQELAAYVGKNLKEELSRKEGIVILEQEPKVAAEPTDLELQKLAQESRAAFVLYGSVTALDDNFSLDARVLSAIQGEFFPPIFVQAQGKEELARGIQKLVGQLAEQITSSWSQVPEAKIKAFFGEGGLKAALPPKAPASEEKPAPASEVKVGLLPFKVNAFDNSSAVVTEVWEALAKELALGGQMVIVGKEMALNLLKDPARVDHGEEGVRNFASEVKADYIVYGSVTQLGQSLSLDSRIFHNVPGLPFTVSKVYVEGSGGEALSAKVRELAFELKRNILRGKIIVTPLAAEPAVAAKAPEPVAPKASPAPAEAKVAPRQPPVPAKAPEPVEPKASPGPAEAKVAPKEPPKPAAPARPGGKQDPGKGLKKSTSPISITARTLEADNRKGTVTFKGQVVAKRDDYTMTADLMVATYEAGAREVKEITATGGVKVTQGDRVAVARKAVFYNDEQKVVLTQEAKVWQGKNEISGEVITVFLQEDRMIVEGGAEQPVSAIIFPAEEEKK